MPPSTSAALHDVVALAGTVLIAVAVGVLARATTLLEQISLLIHEFRTDCTSLRDATIELRAEIRELAHRNQPADPNATT